MNCEDFKPLFSDYWTGTLFGPDEIALAKHLADCAGCRQELADLADLWRALALIPEMIPGQEPSAGVRTRFYESLRAYLAGADSLRESNGRGGQGMFSRCWPRHPVWQLALGMGCLILGLGLGAEWSTSRDNREVAHLKAEVDSTRELVVLSLLRQESASDRLRGVSWANQIAPADTNVVAALVESVNHDPNVNVRLAAVEALRSFSSNPLVRQATSGIPEQTAPLVQVALIELAVDLRQRQAAGLLRQMANNHTIDPGVQERARWALERLQ